MKILAALSLVLLVGCVHPNPIAHWDKVRSQVAVQNRIAHAKEIQAAQPLLQAMNGGVAINVGSAFDPSSWQIFNADKAGHIWRTLFVAGEGYGIYRIGDSIAAHNRNKSSDKKDAPVAEAGGTAGQATASENATVYQIFGDYHEAPTESHDH